MILPALVAILSVAAFMAVLSASGAVGVARRAVSLGSTAAAALRDPALDEAAREKAAQSASLALFGAFFGLTLRAVLSLAGSAVPILAAHVTGLLSIEASLAFMMRVDVIIILSVAGIAAWIVGARLWPSK